MKVSIGKASNSLCWESQTTREIPIYFFLNDFFPHTPYSSSLPPFLSSFLLSPLSLFSPPQCGLYYPMLLLFRPWMTSVPRPRAQLPVLRSSWSGFLEHSFPLIVSTLLFNRFCCALLHLPIKGKCLTFTLKVQVSFIHRYLLIYI